MASDPAKTIKKLIRMCEDALGIINEDLSLRDQDDIKQNPWLRRKHRLCKRHRRYLDKLGDAKGRNG